jgi:hypothetical protein
MLVAGSLKEFRHLSTFNYLDHKEREREREREREGEETRGRKYCCFEGSKELAASAAGREMLKKG